MLKRNCKKDSTITLEEITMFLVYNVTLYFIRRKDLENHEISVTN